MSEYIEREALMKNFCGFDLTECVKYGNRTKEQASRSFETLMMYEIADVVEDAPAADVAPVVKGIWKDYGGADAGFHYCSECKAQAFNYEDDGQILEVLSNYCPYCGAKMETAE